MSTRESIRVLLWGEEIGIIRPSTYSPGEYAFQYNPNWVSLAKPNRIEPSPIVMIEPSPIVMPVSASPYRFTGLGPTYHGLPGMIADAMPDRFGNAVIDAYMAKKGLLPHQITPLQRLAYIGTRAMGALEFEPADPQAHQSTQLQGALEMRELVESARAAIHGTIPDVHDTLLEIGSSAGGARAKAIVAYSPETQEIISGQLAHRDGYQHYLLKFDGVEGQPGVYGRREAAYLRMAKDAGINAPHHFLIESGSRAHLMIKRFDRTDDGDKLHMQTLCGLTHMDFQARLTHEYLQLFRVGQQLNLGAATTEEIFRRMTFNVASVNRDDHTKNQSFLMNRHGEWSLSPAYDIGFAWNPNADGWTHEHQMRVNGKGKQIHKDDLLEVGKSANLTVPRMETIIDEVVDTIGQWLKYAEAEGVSEEDAVKIKEHQDMALAHLMGKKWGKSLMPDSDAPRSSNPSPH